MNQPIDTERVLDAYLAPEADRLPDRVLESAFAEIARTPQRRGIRIPWTYPAMQGLARLATVALTLVVAVGGGIYVADRSMGPGDDPSGSPSDASPSSSDTTPPPSAMPSLAGTVTFTSPRFGYTVDVPVEFAMIPATTDWPAEDVLRADVSYVDVLDHPDVNLAGMSAQLVPDAMTAGEWMAGYAERAEASGRDCAGQAIAWVDRDVWGVPGRAQSISCELNPAIEALWVVDGIGYAFIGPISLFNAIEDSFAPAAVPTSTPTPPPTASQGPTPGPSFASDIVSWTSYSSETYGYGAAYPADWTVDQFATRTWDAEADGLNPGSRGMDTFRNAARTVTVSRWQAPHEPEDNPGDPAMMLAWVEELCQVLGDTRCNGISERAISLCPESYCNAAFVVPFRDHVLAFDVGTPDDTVNIVAIWLPESDPALAGYGGARNLLRAFVERG